MTYYWEEPNFYKYLLFIYIEYKYWFWTRIIVVKYSNLFLIAMYEGNIHKKGIY